MAEKLPLLLEIGTEELPPAFIAPTAGEIERRVRAVVQAGSPGRTFFTPRRLAVLFDGVAPERPGREVEVQGPPRKAAFDAEGRPTRVAEGFSRSGGCTLADLYVKETERGEYVFLRRTEPSVRTAALLEESLPRLLAQLPFARSMRWLEDDTRFARPVRWLVCLLGAEVVPFRFASLTAGRLTRGHRRSGPEFELASARDYEAVLAGVSVVVEPEARRRAITEGATRLAAEVGGVPVLDPELVETTVGITESPLPIRARLDPAHLELPAVVLVSALKMHQRCFAVRKRDSENLLPWFIAFADTPGCDPGLAGRWLGHAVDSRLRDARFFYETDATHGLAGLVEMEKRVVWFEGMGSYFDKTERLRALVRVLGEQVGGVDPAILDRAAELAKADLLTSMVREKEFTSLQGVMGGIYARAQGEPDEVAEAISEQYLPAAAGDALPVSRAGALLGIADRLDNVVGAFLAGETPTGSEDPFALRRQASGIFAIVFEHGLPVDLAVLRGVALELYEKQVSPDRERVSRLAGFLLERAGQALADRGIPGDIADAVNAVHADRPLAALLAARALLDFRARSEFNRLVIGQKRVANILRGQQVKGLPDPARFTEAAECELWQQAQERARRIEGLTRDRDYAAALSVLLELRPTIDRLFDDVLVMDKDPEVRSNRLRLLLAVRGLFRQVADLSRVVVENAVDSGR